jgi:ABC-type transport system substrate-binding protein
MKKIIILLFLSIGILSLPAYGKTPEKNTLRIGISTFPASLNPVYVTDETSLGVVNKIFNSLFYFDFRGKVKNGLVSGYRLSQDAKTIMIELKNTIYFANGRELNSHDVVQTLQLIKDSRFKYPYAANISFIKEVKAIDKYILSITLHERSAAWKKYLTFHILNAHEIENMEPEAFRNASLSGTGYYKINEINEPGKILLELKNPGENPRMYRYIEYLIVKNTQLAPMKLMKNEIDICELQPENAAAYNNIKSWQKKFTIVNYKKFGYTYLVFNSKSANLDKNTGKLFYDFLVCGDFIDRFLTGKGEKVKTPFLLLNDKITSKAFKITGPEKSIELKLLTNSESKLRKDFVLFLRSELKPYNINIEPVFLEYHTFLQYLKSSRFDIALSGFLIEIDYDMKDIFYKDAAFNYANFDNPLMDSLLDKGLRELNSEKREKIYTAAHKVWLAELPLIPLFNLYYYMGISRNIKIPAETYDIVGSTGDFLFNIEEWSR